MARKAKYDWGRSSGKYQKFETRLALKWSADNSNSPYSDSVFVDVAQCLSIVNRKLVRQGQVFKIKNMRAYTNDDDQVSMIKVGTLPRTWCMFNAYKKARGLWNAHNLEALEDLGAGNLPAYYDFKVLMDDNHVTNELGSGDGNLLPTDFEDSVAGTGEWVYSSFHDSGSTPDVHFAHMLGGHMSDVDTVSTDDTIAVNYSVGAILAYNQSRGFPASGLDSTGSEQQTATELRYGPWGKLRGDDDQRLQVITDLTTDNDEAPYDRDNMPGTRTNLPAPVTVFYGRLANLSYHGTNTSTAIPQFEAPLGLIRVEIDAEASMNVDNVHIHFDTEIMGAC